MSIEMFGEDVEAKPTDLQAEMEAVTNRNYDEEATKLFSKLNLGPLGAASTSSNSHTYNNLDPVWKNPSEGGGGIVFVGNATAAASLHILDENKITKVVNCADSLPCYHQKGPKRNLAIEYYRFDIYKLFSKELQAPKATAEFFNDVFEWIDEAISNGENVLIHCLAGAHRAGCTGVGFVMHASKLSVKDAIKVCSKARSAIQIFPELKEFLDRLAEGKARHVVK